MLVKFFWTAFHYIVRVNLYPATILPTPILNEYHSHTQYVIGPPIPPHKTLHKAHYNPYDRHN